MGDLGSRRLRNDPAAAYLGLSPRTLEKKRLTGGGPTFDTEWGGNSTICKHGAPNPTPVFDQNGMLYTGTNCGEKDLAAMDGTRNGGPPGHTFDYGTNVDVDGAPAIGDGWLVFIGDNNRVHCIGCN